MGVRGVPGLERKELTFEGHLMLSATGLELTAAEQSDPHFLPTQAASTLGLLALFLQWGRGPANAGGFREDRYRRAAIEFSEGFIDGLSASADEWVLRVEPVDDWRCMWPRPQTKQDGALEIKVDPKGFLDLAQWQMLVLSATMPKHHP